ncbi:MAG: NAD(P)/FAD-dependent oxidoreductase, partial [Balneolaceae bacterium]
DALSIRERILVSLETAEQLDRPEDRKPYLTYVVIGGGPTGVEMAGAIAEITKRSMMRDYRNVRRDETGIYLVEAAPRILNGYPEYLSGRALRDLKKMGVTVLLNSPVKDIEGNAVQLGHRRIKTANIIWAAGVTASPLLKSLDADQDRQGRIKVNPDLSLPGSPDIFVIGDAAYLENTKGEPLPAIAPVALQQGEHVGKLIRKQNPATARKPFHYTDKGSMATIGRAKAVADIRGFRFTGFIAWMLWSVVHIFFLIGFRNRFRVFAEWMWYYFTFKRGVRLITKRP